MRPGGMTKTRHESLQFKARDVTVLGTDWQDNISDGIIVAKWLLIRD